MVKNECKEEVRIEDALQALQVAVSVCIIVRDMAGLLRMAKDRDSMLQIMEQMQNEIDRGNQQVHNILFGEDFIVE